MTKLMLPKTVVRDDIALDKTAEGASTALAAHRWHWTLDESNPDRVSARQYAREVGKNESTIRRYAKAHELLAAGGSGRTFGEAYERAAMSTETEAATEAVAKAEGVSMTTARKTRPEQVRRVKEYAREIAEKEDVSVEDATTRAAEAFARAAKSDAAREQRRRASHTTEWILLEGTLGKARRMLMTALKQARGVEFDDEEVELLTESIEKIRAVMDLLDMAIAGAVSIDWDTELAKLTTTDEEK